MRFEDIALPWVEGPEASCAWVRERVRADQMLVGFWGGPEPWGMSTGLLASHGYEASSLMEWSSVETTVRLAAGFWQRSMERGWVVWDAQEDGDAGLPSGAGRYVLGVALMAEGSMGARWTLALTRREAPFRAEEARASLAMLRLMRGAFEGSVQEAGVSRALVAVESSCAGKVLVSDARMELRLALSGRGIEGVLAEVWPVLLQRYGEDWPEQMSMVTGYSGVPAWVLLRENLASHCGDVRSYYLEVREADADGPPALGVMEDDRIARATAFLADRACQSPSLNDVAAYVEMSPYHFHRRFSKLAGVSPKHYLLRCQIRDAKHLLQTTSLPIGQIATETGFASHGHFTATFRKLVGDKPSDLRTR
ncbi:MAG: AraC family transcriptional regulator [Planctomycetota bacterium]